MLYKLSEVLGPFRRLFGSDEVDPDSQDDSLADDSMADRTWRLFHFESVENPLFLEFADANPTVEGMLGFTVKYWNLGPAADAWFSTPGRKNAHEVFGKVLVEGEPLAKVWGTHVRNMRSLTSLWLAMSYGDNDLLAQCITRERDAAGQPVVYFTPPPEDCERTSASARRKPERSIISSVEIHPDWLKWFEEGDPIATAHRYLAAEVQRQLAIIPGKLDLHWRRRQGFTLHFRAKSLLGQLWVSFAEAIAVGKKFRRCDGCQTWFEIAPDAARTHRRYCSESCRGKAYRGRQDRARQLYAQNRSFEEIAAELDSDVPTVKRWITGFKE